MTGATQFPAFIKLEYDGSGRGTTDFARAINTAFDQADGRAARFKATTAEVARVVKDAVAGGANSLGGLDLGVGKFRQAAAEARLMEEGLRLTERAARELAVATGDTSQRTRDYVGALQGEKNAAIAAREAADAQVTTYTRLQGELDRTAQSSRAYTEALRESYGEQARAAKADVNQQRFTEFSTPGLTESRRATSNGAGYYALAEQAKVQDRYAASLRELISQIDPVTYAEQRRREQTELLTSSIAREMLTEQQRIGLLQRVDAEYVRNAQSTRQQRFAYLQLGQQLQDTAIQAQLGVNPFVILTQQGSQASFALAGLAGSANKVEAAVGKAATTLAGPWGAAVLIGITAIGTLIASFYDQAKAEDTATQATEEHKRAIDDLVRSINESTKSQEDRARDLAVQAENERLVAIQTRERNKALLEQARAYYEIQKARATGPSQASEIVALGLSRDYDRVSKIEAAIKANDAQIAVLSRASNIARGQYQATIGDQLATPEGRLDRTYAQRRKAIIEEGASARDTARQLVALTAWRDAEREKIKSSSQVVREHAAIRETVDRDAIRAAAELQRNTDALIARLDPGRKAAADYRDTIESITAALNAGTISKAEADQYFDRAASERQAALDKLPKGIAERPDYSLAAIDGDALLRSWYDRQIAAAREAQQAMAQGAEALSDFFGQELGIDIESISRRLNNISAIGRLAGQGDPIEVVGKKIERVLGKAFDKDSPFVDTLGKLAGAAAFGASVGGLGGDLLFSNKSQKAGAEIGGAIGAAAGSAIAGPLGEAVGAVAGTVFGGLIGGAFYNAPRATALVTSITAPATVTGNNQQLQQALSGVSVNLQSSLQKIVDQLGGIAGNFEVSIGQREDYYRVSGTGSLLASAKYPDQPGAQLLYNGQDAQEALRIAILNAVQDGAVQGIREGTRRLLSTNQDLDLGLSKATRYEQAFKDLKKLTDPVGAALDDINLKFRQLNDIFHEAGASAGELAQLEDLYGRQRKEAVKAASEALTSPFESLLKDLTQGDNGLSLRSRLASAQQSYSGIASRVASGDTTAFAEYSDAARTRLDLERQLYGSQSDYFTALNDVTGFTQTTLADQQAKIAAASAVGTPFDTKPIVSATETQTQALLAGLAPYLQSIAQSQADLLERARNGDVVAAQLIDRLAGKF